MIELWGEVCWPTIEMRTMLTFLVHNQSLAFLLSTSTPDLPHLVVHAMCVRTYVCMYVTVAQSLYHCIAAQIA